jgi:hypothetical protein
MWVVEDSINDRCSDISTKEELAPVGEFFISRQDD